MPEPLWRIVADKSEPHWLELEDPEGWYSAAVKWDGCIDFNRYFNQPKDDTERNSEDTDYLHICDVDAEIARLRALKAMAEEWFTARQGAWPG